MKFMVSLLICNSSALRRNAVNKSSYETISAGVNGDTAAISLAGSHFCFRCFGVAALIDQPNSRRLCDEPPSTSSAWASITVRISNLAAVVQLLRKPSRVIETFRVAHGLELRI